MTMETKVADWATEAADGFLNSGVGLNTTIKKIASRENLNREKVARVVEESNKAVFLKMFEKQADKCFTFDVADTDKIIAPKPETRAKVAMAVVTAPAATPMAKTAADLLTDRAMKGTGLQQCQRYLESAILGAETLREKAGMARELMIGAETQFCKEAQQMVLQDGYSFPEIFTAMAQTKPTHWKKIGMLLKVASVTIGQKWKLPETDEIEKLAGAAVDPGEHDIVQTISTMGMPVEVINGSHKIVMALDTLIAQATEAEKANAGLRSADDTVKYLRKEIRNYVATHQHV